MRTDEKNSKNEKLLLFVLPTIGIKSDTKKHLENMQRMNDNRY